jgi:hypothetical protein
MTPEQRAEWQTFCTTPEAQDELMRAWARQARKNNATKHYEQWKDGR